nr:MAG TPA: antirepressor protein [Caudoviricetes sp.]
MNELLRVNYDSDRITLSARELHEFLGIKTKYKDWFPRMVAYGFDENVDYRTMAQKRATAQGNETTYNDHEITLDMAKEIAMIQRSEKGKQVRQYFLELERKWNSPEAVMNRALEYSRKQVQALLQTNEKLELENKMKDQQLNELKPKADYYDQILQSKSLVLISQIAKDYGYGAPTMNKKLHELGVQYKQGGQWLLYSKYQNKGYTHSRTINITRSDGRSDVRMQTEWTQKGRLFLYELLKKNGILPIIEQN